MLQTRAIATFLILFSCFFGEGAVAQNCYSTSILSPAPFLGNNGEIFRTTDGKIWEVKFAYEYLYEYYPQVYICNESKLMVSGKSIDIVLVGSTNTRQQDPARRADFPVKIILKPRGCRDYFLADGDSGGVYLLEWYGGYDPDVGDAIVGDLRSYGFKDVIYPANGSTGRVYVDDYMLSRSRAVEKLREKCR